MRLALRAEPGAAGPRGVRPPGRVTSLLVAALALAVPAVDAGSAAERDPGPVLARHYAPLARVERRAAPALGARVERWRLITARGDTVRALWRAARAGVVRPWTAVMLGGFHTGDRAALLLPEDSPFNALAVNWPWSGPRRLTPAEFALRLPAIERAILRSPSTLALGVEAVTRARGVDPSRIVLVGASLGVPPALAALRLTGAPDAVVLLDGGADLEMLIRAGLEREGWYRGAASLSALAAFHWIWPLEPTLNSQAAARIPVLLVNSSSDERVPRASISKLHAGLPHATVRWRPGSHIRPSQHDVIARLTRDADAWLRAREGDRSGVAVGPRTSATVPR